MPRYSPFIRRVRSAARVALYSSLVLVGLVGLALGRWLQREIAMPEEMGFFQREQADHPAVALLSAYLQVDTSPATGSEEAGALFLAAQLRALGLEPVVEVLPGGRANLWAVLEGESPEALVLHNHVDVTDAPDPEAWTHPPFAGVVDPPFIYGRGVFDMKSIAVAQLAALEALTASGKKPRRSVIFLATGGEELGSELGTRWVLRRHPELAARFWAVLTEGAVVEPVSPGVVKYWGIEFAQKRFAQGWACAPTRARLESFAADLDLWQRARRRPRLAPEVARFLAAYGPSREHPVLRDVLDVSGGAPPDPFRFRLLPAYLQALFVNEIAQFPIEEDPAGGYRMRLSVHLLPGEVLDAVAAELLPAWLTHGIDLALGAAVGAAVGSPLDHPVYAELERSIARRHPEAPAGPMFLYWSATDSRFFRELGVPSYGYSPFLSFNIESLRADRRNERINLPGFVDGVEIYVEVVRRLVE
jgi:acetylornithine deacetylase/succinyl-diaminopimelate desuccinylase-like protein